MVAKICRRRTGCITHTIRVRRQRYRNTKDDEQMRHNKAAHQNVDQPVDIFTVRHLEQTIFTARVCNLLNRHVTQQVSTSKRLSMSLVGLNVTRATLRVVITVNRHPQSTPHYRKDNRLTSNLTRRFTHITRYELEGHLFTPATFTRTLNGDQVVTNGLITKGGRCVKTDNVGANFSRERHVFKCLNAILSVNGLRRTGLAKVVRLRAPRAHKGKGQTVIPRLNQLSSKLKRRTL